MRFVDTITDRIIDLDRRVIILKGSFRAGDLKKKGEERGPLHR